jgi:hypothetical protein
MQQTDPREKIADPLPSTVKLEKESSLKNMDERMKFLQALLLIFLAAQIASPVVLFSLLQNQISEVGKTVNSNSQGIAYIKGQLDGKAATFSQPKSQ